MPPPISSTSPLAPASPSTRPLSGQLFGGSQYVAHRQRGWCVCSRCSSQERRSGKGERGDERTSGGVEEEVVAGGDDHEQYERRVRGRKAANKPSSSVAEQAGGDDQRVADVHARNGRVRVVERADEPVVEVEVAARDGVGDADSGQSRRRSRVGEEADERERAGDEKRGADERKGRRATPVQPEKDDGRHRYGASGRRRQAARRDPV